MDLLPKINRLRASASEPFALIVVFLMMISGFSLWMLFSHRNPAEATTNPLLITFQAKLTDQNRITVPDSALNVKFAIYDASSGGTCFWSAKNTDSNTATIDCPSNAPGGAISVTPTEGVVSVLLGDTTASQNLIPTTLFNAHQDLWLGVTVGSDSEMTPRIRLTSTPYAFYAGDSDKLDGLDSTAFASTSNVWTLDGTAQTVTADKDMTLSGGVNGFSFDGTTFSVDAANNRIGIGTAAPSTTLHVRTDQNADTAVAIENQTNGTAADAQIYLSTASGFGSIAAFPSSYTSGGTFLASKMAIYNQTLSGGMIIGDGASGGGGVYITTNGTPDSTLDRAHFKSTGEVVFNDPGNDYDFRVESDTNANMLFVDAGADCVNIGSSSLCGSVPATLAVSGATNTSITSLAGTTSADVFLYSGASMANNIYAGFAIDPTGSDTGHVGAVWTTGQTGSGVALPMVFTTRSADPTVATRNRFELYPTGAAGGAVFNEPGNDYDFRVETDNAASALFVDASADDIIFNDDGISTANVRIEGDNNANLFFTDAANDRIGIGTAAPDSFLHVAGGTLGDGAPALRVTGTLAATGSLQRGAVISITGSNSGVAGETIEGVIAGIGGTGYTGNGDSVGANLFNESVGTGSSLIANYQGNYAAKGQAYGATATGYNIGFGANAINGLRNYGFMSRQLTDSQTNGYNVGFLSYGKNGASGGVLVGVAGILGTSASPSDPTLLSAAGYFDNGDTTNPIFLARDNASTVFTIADGGAVTATSSVTTNSFLQVAEIAAPSTPSSGFGRVYEKSDGILYFKNDAGTEFDLTTTGGTSTLQAAYDGGATITTASSTDIAFTLASGNFVVKDSGGIAMTTFTGSTGAVAFANSVALGDSNADTISITGRIDTPLIPTTNNTLDLGDDTHRWNDLFVGPGSLHVGTSDADGATISYDTSANTFNFANNTTTELTLGPVTGDIVTVTGGTLTDTKQAFEVTGTFPASTSAPQIGALFNFTTAGTSAQDQRGLQVTLGAGYTGANNTYGTLAINNAASSDTNSPITNPTVFGAAAGVAGFTHGASTGNRVGVWGISDTGTTNNIGALGIGWVQNSMTGKAYGVIGAASAQSGQTATGYGGYFYVNNGGGTVTAAGSAALVADNRTVASDIFVAMDNGSPVFTVGDGGALTSTGSSWTVTNDLAVTLSGGVNGLNFDSNTLSIDATNNRVGIGTAAPDEDLEVRHDYNGATVTNLTNTDGGTSARVVYGLQADATGNMFGQMSLTGAGFTPISALLPSQLNFRAGNLVTNGFAIDLLATDAPFKVYTGGLGTAGERLAIYGTTTGETVFNDTSNNFDFRVESDGNPNGIFLDASAETIDLVGGSGATGCSIDASGNLTCSGTITGSGGAFLTAATGWTLDGTSQTVTADKSMTLSGGVDGLSFDGTVANTLSIDTANGFIGVGTAAPGSAVDAITNDAITNGPTVMLTLHHTTTGTAANGIATQIQLNAERANGTDIGVAFITGIITDATAADTALAFSTRVAAGALTEQMRIDGNGNVGIGDTTPDAKLDVAGSVQWDGNATIGDASGDTVTSNAASWTFANDTTVALTGGVNGLNFDSNTLSIDATNNRIGIGTAAPDRDVVISKDANAQLGIRSYGTGVSPSVLLVGSRGTAASPSAVQTGDSLGDVDFCGQLNGTVDNYTCRGLIQGIATENWAPGSAGNQIQFSTAPNTTSTALVRMTVDEDGNVGIGTTNPSDPLHILKSTSYSAGAHVTGSGNFAAMLAQNDTSSSSAQLIAFGSTASGTMLGVNRTGMVGLSLTPVTSVSGAAVIRVVNASPLVLGTNDAERMRIDSSGNVGIGDTSPAALLTVGSGDLFQVDSSGNLTSPSDITWTLGGGVNGINFDSNTLSIDATNNRIGIGTAAPSYQLHAFSSSGGTIIAADSTSTANGSLVRVQNDLGNVVDIDMLASSQAGAGGAIQADAGLITTGVGVLNIQSVKSGTPSIGFYTSTTSATAGLERARIANGEFVINDSSNDYDFRAETDTNANGIFLDASAETIDLVGGSGSTGCTVDASGNLTCSGTIAGSGGGFWTLDGTSQTVTADKNISLSGGVNGLSFDGSTFSIDAANDRIGIGTNAPGSTIDATAAQTGAANTTSYNFTVTTSGTGTNGVFGLGSTLAAGFTGSGFTEAGYFENDLAGTNTAYGTDATYGYRPNGNRGVGGNAIGVTAGHNVGGLFLAGGGAVNYGSWSASTVPKNGATNVGAIGFGLNTATGGGEVQVGGYFSLFDGSTSAPTIGTSAALIANNGSQTSDIFSARDNGTAVLTIADGGTVTATGNVVGNGNFTFGDAGADSVTSNAATWTFANDTAVALTGGVNGLNFDSNTLSIDATNNRVGIGTAAPAAQLEVNTNQNASTFAAITNTTSGTAAASYLQFTAGATNSYFGSYSALFSSGGDTTYANYGTLENTTANGGLLLTATGQTAGTDNGKIIMLVGSSLGSPASQQEVFRATPTEVVVNDTSRATVDFRAETDGNANGIFLDASAETIDLVGGSGSTGCSIDSSGNLTCSGTITGSASAFVQNGNSFGTGATLGTNDNNTLSFETNNVTKMTITTAGNVGVGTASPQTTYDTNLTVSNTGSGKIAGLELQGNVSTPDLVIGGVEFLNNSSRQVAIQAIEDGGTTTTRLDFYVSNAGSENVQALTIDSTGSVGIGDSTPDALLDVAGSVQWDGSATIGDAGADSVTSNAASWTFANDTAVALSGGVNGINFDSNTLSIDAANNRIGIGTAAPLSAVEIVAGTMTDNGTTTASGIYFSGTMQNSATTQSAIRFDITGAGSGAANKVGLQSVFYGGYTGSSITIGADLENLNAGTGNDLSFGALSNPSGNSGINGFSYGTTTGLNIGSYAAAANGNVSVGVVGVSTTAKNSATNIGVIGVGRNSGTTPIEIGGYFGLHTTTPTFASAALMADNGSTTSDIFVARDNGSSVFAIQDGGVWSLPSDTAVSLGGGVNGINFDSNTLSIDATNDRVGVGTAAPSEKMTVVTATANYGFLHSDGTVEVGTFVNSSTGIGNVGTKSNHKLGFFTNNQATQMTLDTSGNLGIGDTTPDALLDVETTGIATDTVTITAGSLASTKGALKVTGTLPSSAAGQDGSLFTFTGAGSGAGYQSGLGVTLAVGYTGSASSYGGYAINNSAGTNTGGIDGALDPGTGGNLGWLGRASGSTAGHNFGVKGTAEGSSTLNDGVAGMAVASTAGTNIGVSGIANGGTTNTIGVFAGLYASNTAPSFTSGALVADNAATTSPIIVGRDGGSTVFTVADGGDVTMTGDLNLNGSDLVTSSTGTATVFNTNATTVNVGGASTTLNLAGGSGSTGCTVDSSGNLTCSGSVSGGGGTPLTSATGWTLDGTSQTVTADKDMTLSGGVNGFSFDGTTFSVDATNNRIGIGTATPAFDLNVKGTSADATIQVENTGASNEADVVGFNTTSNSRFLLRTFGSGIGSTFLGVNRASAVAFQVDGSSSAFLIGTTATAGLTLGTNSAAALTIDGSTQNVGIGDTTPAAMLTVGSGDKFQVASTGVLTSTVSSGNSVVIDTSTLVVDASNNRVGIGTASPSADLDIQGTSATAEARVQVTGAGSEADLTLWNTTANSRLLGRAFGSTAGSTFLGVSRNSAVALQVDGSSSAFLIGTTATAGLTLGTNSTAALTIDGSTQNVGIGDATPDAFFSVGSSSQLQVTSAGNLSTSGTITSTNGSTSAVVVDTTTFVVDASNNRVGIGTASPSTDLNIVTAGSSTVAQIQNTSTTGLGRFIIRDNGGTNNINLKMNGSAVAGTFLGYTDASANYLEASPASGTAFHIRNTSTSPTVMSVNGVEGLTITSAETVVNEAANDYDFRVEGQGASQAFLVDASANDVIVNEGSSSLVNFRVEGDTNANLLFTDATNDRVGIGTATPATVLNVVTAGASTVAQVQNTTTTGVGRFIIRDDGGTNFVSLRTNGSAVAGTFLGYTDASANYLETNGSGGAFFIRNSGTTPIVMSVGDVERLTVSNTEVVVNEGSSGTVDFRAETDGNANGIFLDASAETIDLVGGSGSTGCSVDASGNMTCSGTVSGSTGAFANAALSNLASVAINTSLLPSANDSIDLGDNTHRWANAFLGGETLHVGSSTTDEGTIAYNNSTNLFTFGTDATGAGDLVFAPATVEAVRIKATTGLVGIGDTTPDGQLDVTASQPTSVASATGTNATDVMSVTGATGGNTTIATSGTGGEGSDLNIILGAGGTAASATTASTGGSGGDFLVSGATGGAAAVTGGVKTGGTGSIIQLDGGNGGAASGTGTSNAGGTGGAINLTAGNGGTASGATSNVGGTGGSVVITGGNGAASNGSGGNVLLMPGTANGSGTTGRVGANDSTPDAIFDVDGALGTILMATNSGTGASFRINDDGTDTDSTPFSIDASGNVGIGTASPNAILDVEFTGHPTSDYNTYFTVNDNTTSANQTIGNEVEVTQAGNIGSGTDTTIGYKALVSNAGTITTSENLFAGQFVVSGGTSGTQTGYGLSLSVQNTDIAYGEYQETIIGGTTGYGLYVNDVEAGGSAYGIFVNNVQGSSPATSYAAILNGLVGINTATPGSQLQVTGSTPASVATATGTAATDTLGVSGVTGGTTTIATTGTGGEGSDINLTTGNGGVASSAATSSTGGGGGDFTLLGGTGGGATTIGTTRSGGAGGTFSLTAGTGGTGSGGTTNNGGAGGSFSISAGTGGTGATTGGNGGTLTLTGGSGGSTNGNGGNIVLNAGNASGSGTAGQVIISDNGSSSVAAIAWTGDADTGFFHVTGGLDFTVDGTVSIALGDTEMDVQTTDGIRTNFNQTATIAGVCHSGTDSDTTAVNRYLVVCSNTPNDIAEMYETTGAEAPADIVVATAATLTYTADHVDAATGSIAGTDTLTASILARSSQPYEDKVIGVVSTSPAQVYGRGVVASAAHPQAIAVTGRVPVKVSDQNGAIVPGDPITTSSAAGVGMKATQPGMIIGYALDSFTGPGTGSILLYVEPSFHMGEAIEQGPTGNATSGTPGMDSYGLALRGSGWDGAAAQSVAMKLVTDVASATEYKLSIRNSSDAEVAYVTDDGAISVSSDVIVGGKLFPSAQGVAQTDKYIFYGGAGDDFMRTNATGWGTGSYDFAEMFPSRDALEPGDVVAIDTTGVQAMKKAGADDLGHLAGIVSTKPGFVAGDNKPGDHAVALAGRVPVKVSAENGAIAVGDALTVSASHPGYAMKATAAGMIVGYALEPASADGAVVAFVHLGYWPGTGSQPNAGTSNTASNVNGNLTALNMSGNIYMAGNQILNVGAIAGMNGSWSVDAAGKFLTEGSYKTVITSYQNKKVETASVLSTEQKVTLSGTGHLTAGTATIAFEDANPDFNDITSTSAPVRVLVTLRGPANGIYVATADHNGFTAQETMGGTSDADFDWFVEAYRKDYDPPAPAPADPTEPPPDAPPADQPPTDPTPPPADDPTPPPDTTTPPADTTTPPADTTTPPPDTTEPPPDTTTP